VEVAGNEPASAGTEPGLLRVQCAMDFLGLRARAHTSPDRPSRVRVPRRPPTWRRSELPSWRQELSRQRTQADGLRGSLRRRGRSRCAWNRHLLVCRDR